MSTAIFLTMGTAIWLGVIEVANARVSFVLQELRGTPIEPWANEIHSPMDLTKERYGQADVELTDEQLAAIENEASFEAGKNHLSRLVTTFGTAIFVTGPVGILFAIGYGRAKPGWPSMTMMGLLLVINVTIVGRALYLELPQRGFLIAILG